MAGHLTDLRNPLEIFPGVYGEKGSIVEKKRIKDLSPKGESMLVANCAGG